jgi:3-hydroxyisobutyrate dehydrogenase
VSVVGVAVSEEAMAGVVAVGGSKVGSAAEAAAGADVVITMLPSSPHVKDVYETQIFEASEDNALLIDCSTIDPNVTVELSKAAESKKRRMVDAPVSGGVGGAESGTLTFMVGGSQPDFDAAKTFLEAMGKNIVHCGAAGTGQTAKICNNLILGISMNAVAEAMNLG